MARYSTFKYGTNDTYGADGATEGGIVTWILLFNWDNSGGYDGTNEADRLKDVNIVRGRTSYLQEQGGGFEHMRPGRCTLRLDNYDRRYDPRNTGSALSPNVLPGRKMFLAVVDNSTQTQYTVFTGIIDNIIPFNEPGGGEVQIECVDYMAFLNDQQLSFTAAKQNTDITGAYATLLYDADYPGTFNLDVDTQPVHVFGVTDKNAGQVAGELADACLGQFFVDVEGVAQFFSRDHTYPAATSLDEAQTLNDPLVGQPWEDVYNHVTVFANRPIKEQASIIYFLPGPFQFAQSTDTVLDVDYSSAFDVQISTYEANTALTGDGTDITSTTTLTPSLGYNGGTVTVRNNSNAGYLTKLEIRGRSWGTVVQKYLAEDSTSQTTYGTRRFVLDVPYLQDPNYADSFADTLKDFLKDDRENLEVQIQGREDLQYGFELMEKVNYTSSTIDIDDNYWVMGIEHEWNIDTGQNVTTTLHLAKIVTDDTSITAAPVLEEQQQAPVGYENPGGLPENIIENPDWEEVLAIEPSYISLFQESITPGWVDWNDGDLSDPLIIQKPTGPWNQCMWTDYFNYGDRITIRKAGVWYFVLSVVVDPYISTDHIGRVRALIRLYDTDASSTIATSVRLENNMYPDTGTNLTVDDISVTVHFMYEIAENQVIKAYVSDDDGADVIDAQITGWRIAPTP